MSVLSSIVSTALQGAQPPYAHMSEEDAELFYTTLNALLVYANEQLHVVRPQTLRVRPENPLMIYANGGRVSEELWRRRALVADFVRENPRGLSREQLAVARPWRYALRDAFCVLDATPDRLVAMNQDRLFVVGAMQDPADEHVHGTPSLDLLTLLPFKGGIVPSGMTLHLSPRPVAGALPSIVEQARELAARPVIATAHDLVAYARKIPDEENRVGPLFQRRVDEGFASGTLA